jgi:hypothetical protein
LTPTFPTLARDQVLTIIQARGSKAPASIAYLEQRTGLPPRTIKALVEQARMEGKPICASRHKPCGYFWASTTDDLESSALTMRNQALHMLVAAGRLVGRHRLAEMLGQLTTDVEREIAE